MRKIILIPCGKRKKNEKQEAGDLYNGILYKKIYNYAQKLKKAGEYNEIWILSDKYYLLGLDEEIESYTPRRTVNEMGKLEREEWSNKVLEKLKKEFDLEKDKFLILAGQKYWEFLIDKIKGEEPPLKGLNRGQQLHFLKTHT